MAKNRDISHDTTPLNKADPNVEPCGTPNYTSMTKIQLEDYQNAKKLYPRMFSPADDQDIDGFKLENVVTSKMS